MVRDLKRNFRMLTTDQDVIGKELNQAGTGNDTEE